MRQARTEWLRGNGSRRTANGCGNYGTPFRARCYYSALISHSARSAVLPCLVVLAVPSVDNDARRAGPVPSAGSQHLARRRRWVRSLVLLILTALGLTGIAGGGWLGYREMTRAATRAEISAAGQAELASRWERLTAGQMFPARVGYTGPEGVKTAAWLVGIAPRASCRAALDPARRHGAGPAGVHRHAPRGLHRRVGHVCADRRGRGHAQPGRRGPRDDAASPPGRRTAG